MTALLPKADVTEPDPNVRPAKSVPVGEPRRRFRGTCRGFSGDSAESPIGM